MTRPIEERFWEKVSKGRRNACWLWTATKNNKGYGMLTIGTNLGKILAHRLSYEICHGPIPPGGIIMHSCDNPGCVNPRHLALGTMKKNSQDMKAKGRWRNAGHKGEEIGTSKLTEDHVVDMRESYVASIPMRDIMKKHGISRPTAKRAIHGKTWFHLFGVRGPTLAEIKSAKRSGGWKPAHLC